MLKRTIAVLAVLSMVVVLIPAAALAATTSIQVVVTGQDITGAATLTIGKVPLFGAVGGWNDTTKRQTVTFDSSAVGDYDGDGDDDGGTEKLGTTATGSIGISVGGTTYYGTLSLSDTDADGTIGEAGSLTFALPTALSLSGQVVEDEFGDKGVAATDNKVSGSDKGLSGAVITIYKSGTKFAMTTTTGSGTVVVGTSGGLWSAIVGAGSFTVQANVEGAIGGTGGPSGDFYNDDACDADKSAAVCAADPDDIDEGEIQWFLASATAAGASPIVVSVASLAGVNVVYDNDSGINGETWDHIDTYVGTFDDTAGHWADGYIAELVPSVISGCTTTLYCPEATITRAEFAVMVQRATGRGLSVVTTAPFSDVPTSHWAAAHIQDLKALKVIEGTGGAAFNPEAPISRSEAVEMIARAALLDAEGDYWSWPPNPGGVSDAVLMANAAPTDVLTTGDLPAPTLSFIDVPTTYWAARAIHWMVNANGGVVEGNDDGTFGPEDNLTRAEMAALLSRALIRYVEG